MYERIFAKKDITFYKLQIEPVLLKIGSKLQFLISSYSETTHRTAFLNFQMDQTTIDRYEYNHRWTNE